MDLEDMDYAVPEYLKRARIQGEQEFLDGKVYVWMLVGAVVVTILVSSALVEIYGMGAVAGNSFEITGSR